MKKRIVSILAALAMLLALLTGCGPADILDDQVNNLAAGYVDYTPVDPADRPSVLDRLDLMLDEYVSGLQKPSIDDLQQNTIDPSDQGDLFQSVTSDCYSLADMKAVLLKALADTEGAVEFTIDASLFTFDVLYDVVFNQICEEYMIETLGMQKYQATCMPTLGGRVAVRVDYIYLNNKYSLDEIKAFKQQTLTEAQNLVKTLDLTNKSDYDCAFAVNEYLCQKCVYPPQEPYECEEHTPYGALILGSCVCEGYARSAQLLFSLAGKESYYVTGDTPQGGHAWNLIKVDGQFYQLDITWNDADVPNLDYFLVTDEFMSLSRTWNRQKYPASAKKPYGK